MTTFAMTPTQLTDKRTLATRTLRDVAYLLCSFPVSMAAFVAASAALGFTGSALLIPVAIAIVLWVLHGCASAERRLIRSVLKEPAPEPYYAAREPNERFLPFVTRSLTNPQVWLDGLWSLAAWVVGMVTWMVTVILTVTAAAGLLYPAYRWALPTDKLVAGSNQHLAMWPAIAGNVGIGLAACVILPFAARGMAWGQSRLSVLLLANASRSEQVTRLRDSRNAGRSAESAQLARLERDIHDGPQQRLVRLKVDLARAERQLGPDSPAASSLRAAIVSTQDTLDELRALSRGIAPPALSSAGLVAAVRQAAGRPTIPVHVETVLPEVPGILPQHVEQAAYFIVSEALTNVAKHSFATTAWVRLAVREGQLCVDVTDNGRGGARLESGSGLTGLVDRVRSVDGSLEVISPVGGPTTVHATIPLDTEEH